MHSEYTVNLDQITSVSSLAFWGFLVFLNLLQNLEKLSFRQDFALNYLCDLLTSHFIFLALSFLLYEMGIGSSQIICRVLFQYQHQLFRTGTEKSKSIVQQQIDLKLPLDGVLPQSTMHVINCPQSKGVFLALDRQVPQYFSS